MTYQKHREDETVWAIAYLRYRVEIEFMFMSTASVKYIN